MRIGSNQIGNGCDMYVQLTILPRLIGMAALEILNLLCGASVTELIYIGHKTCNSRNIHMK